MSSSWRTIIQRLCGSLTRKNNARALSLALSFTLAGCVTGNAQRFQLGVANFNQQNYQIAFRQLQTPARCGDANAQYAIGYMYYYGRGVLENKHMARWWIELAAAQGHHKAQEALKRIDERDRAIQDMLSKAH